MATASFGRLITAMVTPFDGEGRLDVDGALLLARHLVEHGSDGLVLAGTTGESPVLSDEEKIELWEAVATEVTVPVVAGSTTNDTAHSLELTRAAEKAGVAGILAVTPYYSKPSQSGLLAHFAAVAETTSLPVVLYDIPGRTGRKIAAETTVRLAAEHSNVIGVKDAAADPAAAARLLAQARAGFELYSGDDGLTLPLFAIGAVGAISVASHWIGPEIAETMRLFVEGEVEAAARLNRELVGAMAFQSSDEAPNPLPAKAMLRAEGLPVGQCRLPHGEAPPWLDEQAASLLAELEEWRASPGRQTGA